MYSSNAEQGSFELKNDTKIYYHGNSRKLVYDQIKEKILSGQGVLCVTGETGIGKSFLIQELVADLENDVIFVHLPARNQTFQSLITRLCDELGLSTGREIILVALQSIYKFLEQQQQINPRVVVVIDNAEELQAGVIDKLLLLSVPPSYKNASLQLIFSGLPDVEIKVTEGNQPRRKNSKFFCYRLERLDSSETLDFIKHILKTEASDYSDYFTPAAISSIVDFSSGLPRRIKEICDMSLSAVGVPEPPRITGKLIGYVAKELLLVPVDPLGETLPGQDKQFNFVELKDFSFIKPKALLSNTLLDTSSGIDEVVNVDESEQVTVDQTKTRMSLHISIPFSEKTGSTDVNRHRSRLLQTMNSELKLPLSWGVVAVAVLGIAIYASQSFISPSGESMLMTSPVVTSNAGETLLITDSGQADSNNTVIRQDVPVTIKADPQTTDEDTVQKSGINTRLEEPGDIARALIANLEAKGQSVNLNVIYDHAEKLNSKNQEIDAYLLYFYAAKHGYAKAAFRLAQMVDPTTDTKNRTVFAKASVTQANKWYLQAMRGGYPKAAHYLNQLRTRIIQKAALGDEDARRLVMQFQSSKI